MHFQHSGLTPAKVLDDAMRSHFLPFHDGGSMSGY
jgi:hypothetical protein